MSNRDSRRNGIFASLLGFFILFGSPTAANMEMAEAAEAIEALETAEIAAMAAESEEPLQWDCNYKSLDPCNQPQGHCMLDSN